MVVLSALEIHHLVNELQELVGSKIEKVFQQEKPVDDFLFQLHKPGFGKKYLYVSLPGLICESSFKPVFPVNPPSFCASLRRKLSGARIKTIKQQSFERIIEITISSKLGDSILLFELFSSGNILLLGDKKKILSVFHPKVYSEKRKLLPTKTYAYPDSQINPLVIDQKFFDMLRLKSTKDTLVTFLAVDCSLGGRYSEEVLFLAEIDKDQDPQKTSEEDSKKIFKSLKSFLETESKPTKLEDGTVSPLKLSSKKGEEQDKSFSELIAEIALAELEESEQQDASKNKKESLSKFNKILKSQTQQLEGLKKSEEENKKKGELIYTNYQEVKKIMNEVSVLRKTKSWKEIKEEFKNNSFVKKIDEHKGTITVELD